MTLGITAITQPLVWSTSWKAKVTFPKTKNLIGKLTVSEEDLKQVRADTQKEVLKELKRASQEKLPKFTSLFDDVYDKLTPNLELQRQELIDLVEKYPEHYNPKRYDIE